MGKMELGFLVSLIILFQFHVELGMCDATARNRSSGLGCVERERRALLSFKATLEDPSNLLLSWNSNNRDCCSWEGVKCHKIKGHVISLDLTNPYNDQDIILVAETVDSSLSELKHLTYLDLSSVYFNYSKFPAYLGSLKQLHYLNLSGTYFSGVVPQNLGNLSSLRTLDLSRGSSELRVDDLTWATRLPSLEHLYMSDVNLSTTVHVFEVLTTIPSLLLLSLSDCGLGMNEHLPKSSSCMNSTLLANLLHLDLSQNFFDGEFPCFLPNMTSLTFLDLSANYFTHSGTRDLLGSMKKLAHLNLAHIWINEKVDWISELLGDNCHLKSLNVNGNGINGDISRVFKNTSSGHNLESLSLGDNLIYGELPEQIGELQHLMNLDLSHNLLHGPIPKSLGNLSALTYLDLSSNNFSSPIPTLVKFPALTYLDLSSNTFSGLIPALVGNLSALTILYVYSNELSGSIPSSIGNLTSLRALDLSENQLRGEIPESLGELSDLERLTISHNLLETTLSEAHFAKLSKLQVLHASFNKMIRFGVGYDWVPPFQLIELLLTSSKMGGQFPQWLKNQKALSDLDMSNCRLTGSLPAWLHSSMNSLTTLDVSHNNVSGPIPELSFSTIWALDLSDNMITHLPTNIGHMLPHLQYLNLARNFINASIPDSLCRMKELQHLHLSNNHLSGNLPNCWPSLSNLLIVHLSHNELTGVIPKSIGGATDLLSLQLDANSLTGQIPSTLKNCKNLELLDVGGNNLSGNLPEWMGKHLLDLQFLRLRNNDFSGTIPVELCGLSQLQVMDLANNNITGNIPLCFGNFSGMMIKASRPYTFYRPMTGSLSQVMKGAELEYTTNLRYLVNLDISNNHLVGEIPWELTNLSGLLGLNLSHNHLRGEIPVKIGDMKSLESLDLSNNYLRGIIPATLSKLSFLSQLNLSRNNLSGQIPTGRQLQTLDDPSIYEGNPQLCGAPLQRKCVNDKAPTGPGVENHEAEDEDSAADRIWFCGIIIAGFGMGFWAVIGAMVVIPEWRQAYFRYIEVAMAKTLGY